MSLRAAQCTLWLAAVALLQGCVAAPEVPPPPAGTLQPGVYESLGCEPTPSAEGGPQYARRRLEVGTQGSAWQVTVFADAACTAPLLRVRGRTQSELLGPARNIAGAWAVRVRFLDRHALAHTEAMAAALAAAGCGRGPWQAGLEQAIGEGPCLGMPAITACPFDHDVLRVEGPRLYTGRRSGDGTLCTPDRQPGELNPAPLLRQ